MHSFVVLPYISGVSVYERVLNHVKNYAVYKVDCVFCEYMYVGQTKRCFKKTKI